MKIIKKRKSIRRKDPKKESVFKKLASLLDDQGFNVRREKLRRGAGWRVVSGDCKFEEDSLIFVDQRLSQDDQISFLMSKLVQIENELDPEKLSELPERLREQLV